MAEIDLSKFNIHTDLVIEDENINHEETFIDGIKITKTKKNGHYITITYDDITDYHNRESVGKHLELVLKEILKLNNINKLASCLIIGLGNIKSTPDSLGVKTLDNIIVTSHLFKLGKVSPDYRQVSAITPGVMASTGIESADIIKAIIKEIKPDFVIAIDALAARDIERINKTIQITDTGIHPGSGIGNNRVEISKKTIHIPVIAIGVPTVIMSSTIVIDTINYLYKHISYIKDNQATQKLSYTSNNYKNKLKDKTLTNKEKENLLGLFGGLDTNNQLNLINEVLNKTELNLIVTPTEIDFIIDKLSTVIAISINHALHQMSN